MNQEAYRVVEWDLQLVSPELCGWVQEIPQDGEQVQGTPWNVGEDQKSLCLNHFVVLHVLVRHLKSCGSTERKKVLYA